MLVASQGLFECREWVRDFPAGIPSIPVQIIVLQKQQSYYREYMLLDGLPNLRVAEEEMRACMLSLNTDQQRPGIAWPINTDWIGRACQALLWNPGGRWTSSTPGASTTHLTTLRDWLILQPWPR